MTIICNGCQIAYKPKKNGVVVIETATIDRQIKPYKVWQADLIECPSCNHQVISGFGNNPLRQDHSSDDFNDWLRDLIATAPAVYYWHEK